jgi:predicted permease
MAFLFSLIAIGYTLSKLKLIPDNSETVLSRLENYVFIPALVMGTFMNNFTGATLSSAWKLFLGSFALEMIVIPLAIFCARLCAKDTYTRNIYLYGLAFSNFGFMGNAVVSVLFSDIFMEYIVFTLVLWSLIYLWGVPSLLMGEEDKRNTLGDKFKKLLNPMFVGMLIGMAIGLLHIPVPSFVDSLVTTTGNCMSPVAMLLIGMTIAKIDIKSVLKIKSIYAVTFLRLLVFPLLFIGVLTIFEDMFSRTFIICAVSTLAMPLGLNTIVIPSAYGKDTRIASGMVLVSHTLSCITIPIIFLILGNFI